MFKLADHEEPGIKGLIKGFFGGKHDYVHLSQFSDNGFEYINGMGKNSFIFIQSWH